MTVNSHRHCQCYLSSRGQKAVAILH